MSRVPFGKPERGTPYFPPAQAHPGKRVCRVVARLLPCACRQRTVYTSDAFGDELILNAEPVNDGAYVVVENAFGGQMAAPYDEALHAGWSRFRAHVCPAKVAP